jgi:hypothetical protein
VSEHIRIRGQAELEAAFLQVRREVLAEIKPVLKEIGGEVAKDAQSRAGTEIRNIGSRWERMRVGVTMKGVYVAPTSKRRGGSPRPNLAGLLMDRAMQPALDAKQDAAYARLDELVNVSSARAGF